MGLSTCCSHFWDQSLALVRVECRAQGRMQAWGLNAGGGAGRGKAGTRHPLHRDQRRAAAQCHRETRRRGSADCAAMAPLSRRKQLPAPAAPAAPAFSETSRAAPSSECRATGSYAGGAGRSEHRVNKAFTPCETGQGGRGVNSSTHGAIQSPGLV